MPPKALTNELAWHLADDGWSTYYEEPEPAQELQPGSEGFYFEPPLHATKAWRLSQSPSLGVVLSVSQGRDIFCDSRTISLRRLVVRAEDSTLKKLAAYMEVWLVRAKAANVRDCTMLSAIREASTGAASAFEAMHTVHVPTYARLPAIFNSWTWGHLECFEVALPYQRRALGAALLRWTAEILTQRYSVGLLSLMPYPLQFANSRVLGAEYSYNEASVAVCHKFLSAQQSLARYYARTLGMQRLPDTDFLVASLTPEVVSLFHSDKRWMLALRASDGLEATKEKPPVV